METSGPDRSLGASACRRQVVVVWPGLGLAKQNNIRRMSVIDCGEFELNLTNWRQLEERGGTRGITSNWSDRWNFIHPLQEVTPSPRLI